MPVGVVSKETFGGFIFAVGSFPLGEVLPIGSEAANFTVRAVRKHNKGVVPKEVRDGVFVVPKVVVVSGFEMDINPFKLHQDQGNSVDETDYIWSSRIHVASNMELGCGEEIVILWVFPVNQLEALRRSRLHRLAR